VIRADTKVYSSTYLSKTNKATGDNGSPRYPVETIRDTVDIANEEPQAEDLVDSADNA
jgi:hypothetical protein